MAYKYLNEDGLKAYTKKVKGALKDLHTPIDISTLNTAESKAQNTKNIADFVAKAKAAGITDVDGMAVTCLLSSGYSGVGYLHFVDGNYTLQGVEIQEELDHSTCFLVWDDGSYKKTNLITGEVTSQDLTRGARKPIILTPETTEVDEETYQKLLSDDVDVVFKLQQLESTTFIPLVLRVDKGKVLEMLFTLMYQQGYDISQNKIYIAIVDIKSVAPHACNIITVPLTLDTVLNDSGYLKKSILSPVLQEINLTGTDAERKARLDQFEADWKALTGANDLTGARFVGKVQNKNDYNYSGVFVWNSISNSYEATVGYGSDGGQDSSPIAASVIPSTGALFINPLALDAEVTEMLDAIKYSYTPVPLTATASTNKTQLDLFLSKVPNAQVMHCTYKDVYAGTLHKISTDWFGLLVKNTNNYEDALQVKLQADGTLIEGTTSLAQVNAKLANIIG